MTLTNDDFNALEAMLDRKLDQKLDAMVDGKLDAMLDRKLDQKLDAMVDGKLDAMFDRKLAPIHTELREVKTQITTINDKLDRIEKWIPLDNTYVISPLRQAASRA
jgi:hypothetical protein